MAMIRLWLLCFSLFIFSFAFQSSAQKAYDYSYTIECMPEAGAPQYGGGIITNPEFNYGVEGWISVGNTKLASACSLSGNSYAEVSNILTAGSDGISHSFDLNKDDFYVVSAWFQASGGKTVDVEAKLVASTGNKSGGWMTAVLDNAQGWVHGERHRGRGAAFRGSSSLPSSYFIDSYFQERVNDELNRSVFRRMFQWLIFGWILSPFNPSPKRNGHATKMRALLIKVMNGLIIQSLPYQQWFRYTAFENELKWQFTEKEKGEENYTKPDAMLDFCRSNNITVRGHNVLWDDETYQPKWVTDLNGEELHRAAINHANSVVKRYEGAFIHWDVINENLHSHFISDVTRGNGTEVFELVHRLDPISIPFLNEYSVIEDCSLVGKASPQRYLQKIDQLRSEGYGGPLGIGLESHFDKFLPMIPYVRATIDVLAATGLPVWITELTVSTNLPNQTQYLEMLLGELHSHPAVGGMIIWSAVGTNSKCFSMCLTDLSYKNLPAGDTLDEFMGKYINVADTKGTTDSDGGLQVSLFYGEYEVTVTLPDGSMRSHVFKLVPDDKDVAILRFKI